MKIGGREFSFKLSDEEACNRVYDFMIEMLKHGLSIRSWEVIEKRKIGFLPLGNH
jgi:hypothetical protein